LGISISAEIRFKSYFKVAAICAANVLHSSTKSIKLTKHLVKIFSVSTFWKSNAQAFPVLAQLAHRYLAPRVSSVDNERVFSGTGRLLEPKRKRLTARNSSMLAFLYHNICEIDMEYDWPK
jgi:hypothetical protein